MTGAIGGGDRRDRAPGRGRPRGRRWWPSDLLQINRIIELV